MDKKKVLAVGGAAAVSLIMAVPVFADTSTTTPPATQTGTHQGSFRKGGAHKPAGVIGTITAINGTTLTVTGKNGAAYTVDASNATAQKGFGKNATTITVSSIALNDMVAVQGTVSGDSVTATKILDGLPARPAGSGTSTERQGGMHQPLANATFGTVASINGSTITLTRNLRNASSSPATVTVTTTSTTTYKKNGQADTATDLAVGQRIVAMGTKDSSGNISNATTINIMVRPASSSTTSS